MISAQSHLNNNIVTVAGLQAEVCNLWAQPCLHLFVHLMTSFHQLYSQIHMVPWETIVGPQSQSSRQETYQMILKGSERVKCTIKSGRRIRESSLK